MHHAAMKNAESHLRVPVSRKASGIQFIVKPYSLPKYRLFSFFRFFRKQSRSCYGAPWDLAEREVRMGDDVLV
jgi:hypothetical protein